jgi:hypothetical protein
MASIGADHHAGIFNNRNSRSRASLDTNGAATLHQHGFYSEAFANFRTGTMCVDTASQRNVALSTTSTRYPARASSIAVDAPAHRAPTTIAS